MQCRQRIARGLKQVEGHADNGSLHIRISRLAARIAERKVGKDKTRYAALLDNIAGRAEDDRWDTVRLKMSGNQTHGLVTHRSQGDQQGNINAILMTEVEHRRSILMDGLPCTIDRGHAVKARRQAAEPAFGHVLIYAADRQEGFDIVGMGGRFVPRQMTGVERLGGRSGGCGIPAALPPALHIRGRGG